jgi:hypothetical protein
MSFVRRNECPGLRNDKMQSNVPIRIRFILFVVQAMLIRFQLESESTAWHENAIRPIILLIIIVQTTK